MMSELCTTMGHRLDCAYDGRDGLSKAIEGVYDLVILDVMLPLINGFTVLAQLRKRRTIPVIMLTTRVQPRDRVEGLDRGADDYLPKPFDPDELFARIRAVLRRAVGSGAEPAEKISGDIRLNATTRQVWRNECLVDLTALEFDILALLITSAGRIVSREEIMAALFERLPTPYDRSLDVHISHLRKKLESGHTLIRTVRGAGYVFAAEPSSEL